MTTFPSPRLTLHCTELSHQNLQFLKWEKRVHVGHAARAALWVTYWEPPTPVLPYWDHAGVCGAWPLGMLLWWTVGKDLANNQYWLNSNLHCPSNSPNQHRCSSATKNGGVIWPGNPVEYIYAWLWSSKWFSGPGIWFGPTDWLIVEYSSQPHLTRQKGYSEHLKSWMT